MKQGRFSSAMLFAVSSSMLFSCAGQAVPPAVTLLPVAAASVTWTPSPLPPTSTVMPTSSYTPEPTAIPGDQLYPIDTLGKGIPWLPYDEADRPMAIYYGFNMRKPPFNHVLVRQAFAAAVDREEVARKALEYNFRDAEPATTLTPPRVLARDLYEEVGIPFDPVRARELLRQAGYTTGESFPPTTLLVSVRGIGAPGAYYQMARIIVEMWKTHLGVDITIDTATIPGYPNRFATRAPGIYQLAWGADYNDPDNFLKALFHSNSDPNFGRFHNREFDRLVEEAARLTDPEQRLLLYIQAEQILTEQDVGVIPLYHSDIPVPYIY
jgi:oligopeptide transport system substrate-binding protein